MLPLLELQRGFRRAVLDGDIAAIGHLVAGDGLSPVARIDVHRNNVIASLTAVLGDAFPAIRRLVDERFFGYAAHEFIRARPPGRPCLAEYGARFPDFLAAFPPCRDFAYFPDVARLEWLLHDAARLPELPALAPAALGDVAAADTPRLVFALQPSLGYLASRYPIDRIWRDNRDCAAAGGTIDLDAGGVRLEVRRAAGVVEMRHLPSPDFAFRSALAAGAALEAAADAALAEHSEFALPDALVGLFGDGAIAGVRLAA